MNLNEEALLYPDGTILRRGDGDIYEVIGGAPYFVERRKGEWNQLLNGKVAYTQDLRQDEIEITDIARSLSMQCRWNGWTREFYSVAQHSVYVGIRAGQIAAEQDRSPEFVLKCRKAGIMHDCGEAYLGDLITPIKQYLPLYYEFEHDAVTRIDIKYPFHYADKEVQKIVKQADVDLLFIERDSLITKEGTKSDPYGIEHLNTGLTFEDINLFHHCWLPALAQDFFLKHFKDIYDE